MSNQHPPLLRWLVLIAVAVGMLAGLGGKVVAARPRALNPVQLENLLPGTTAWRLPQSPGRSIEGYASEVSVAPGGALHLHVSTEPAARYRVEVFRVGWYGGAGGRLVACSPGCQGDVQGVPEPVPPFDSLTGYLNAGWPVTESIAVGLDWTSGYYLVELVLTSGPDAGQGSWVPLVVRAPPSQDSAILVQAPVNTWQAYNAWGGRSLYFNHSGAGDNHVSFDRPYNPEGLVTAAGPTRENANLPQVLELPLVRFLERYGYDVSYTTDVDTDANPGELLRHRLVMTAGHDEYWTKAIRDAFEQARDGGTNLAFMGANTGFWQIRYDDLDRTLVEYRKTSTDPEPDPALKTTMFRLLTPPRPECQLLGVESANDNPGDQSIGIADYSVNPTALADPWFTGTRFTATTTFPRLVGYEWDMITPNCQTPPLTDLFHYPGNVPADGVRYTAASGARVFSAGTLRFSWALDPSTIASDPGVNYGNQGLQQFMRNALDDLTRPAPAISIRAVRIRSGIRVLVQRHPDARVRRLLVYVHTGTQLFRPSSRGTRLVCATRLSACLDRSERHVNGLVRYAVVLRDRWRLSPPAFSQPFITR